jgi:DUF4097 and DUF4098 domain-containing protein YvlB
MTTFDTSGPIVVTVDVAIRADVWVTAGDRTDTVVQVQPRSAARSADVRAAEEATVEYADGRLVVRFRPLRRLAWFGDGGAVDVTIEVPIGSELELTSGMGELRCRGEFRSARLKTAMGSVSIDHCGPLSVHSGHGDITIEHVAGPLDVVTGSGRLGVGQVDGDATLRNGNGDTMVGGVTGELRARASNGDITVGRADGPVNAKSSNGSVRVGEVVRGSVTVGTSAGSIEVGVREGSAAWLELSTKYGRVRNALEAAADPGDAAATVEIRAHSSYGDITIQRSERV